MGLSFGTTGFAAFHLSSRVVLKGPHILDGIGHTVWSKSLSTPGFMVLKSAPTARSSLIGSTSRKTNKAEFMGLLEAQSSSTLPARDFHSTGRGQSSLCKWHLQPEVWDKITQEKSNGTKIQNPREQGHFMGRWRECTP